VQIRYQAGMIIKNGVYGKDGALAEHKKQRWLALDGALRAAVKGRVLSMLRDASAEVAKAASIAIAFIGAIECSAEGAAPGGQWPELCAALHDNITQAAQIAGAGGAAAVLHIKQYTLNCMGFLCEQLYEADVDLPKPMVDKLLTAIIHCMDGGASNPPIIRHAAVKSLSESLPFTQENFANPAERNAIMKKVCEATQCQGQGAEADHATQTRRYAFVCMTIVAADFYQFLPDYMQAIYQLTLGAIKTDTEDVAHYAIEFWNTLCDVEEEITEEQEIFEEATRNGDNPSQPQRTLANYLRGAVKHLVPVIFESMCKQNDYDDEQSLAIQASCCMQLCARAVGDAILEFTMPLISGNIRQPDWHKREAATYAFGAIMEGCSEQAISQVTLQSLPVLVEMVKSEQHGKTKETAAWTLSRVTEFQFNVIPPPALDQVITAALTGLSDPSGGVCHQCCSILERVAKSQDDQDDAPTNVLSKYFSAVLQQLTVASGRADHQEHNLRLASHEAINIWVENSANDSVPTIAQLLPALLNRLGQTMNLTAAEQTDIHPRLLSTINQAIARLGAQAKPMCPQIMQLALAILQSNSGNPVAEAECLLLITAVMDVEEDGFGKYLPSAFPFVLRAVTNVSAVTTCNCAISILGDAMAFGMSPQQCDQTMTEFINILRNAEAAKEIKPTVFTAFGAAALGVGGNFAKYLPSIMPMMAEAACVQVDQDNEDLVEYISNLRAEIMSTYTCIIQGMKDGGIEGQMMQYMNQIFQVIMTIATNEEDEEVLNPTTGLLGDMAQIYGQQIKPLLQQHNAQGALNGIIVKCQGSDDAETQQIAGFAMEQVKTAMA
jgi:importin subunit beta-1